MIETFIAVSDPHVRDIIRTAFRSHPAFRVSSVPREELVGLITPPAATDVVVVDVDPTGSQDSDFLGKLRAVNRNVTVIAVGERPDRMQFNRAKIEHSLHTVIATPIDPFDLARRVHRILGIFARRRVARS